MAKPKEKAYKSSLLDDDLLDSLLDDKKQPRMGKTAGSLNRSSVSDNIFSMLAEEVKQDGGNSEVSDVSAADPDELLRNMKDIDDMDADLFATKKKTLSAPATKLLNNDKLKTESNTSASNVKSEEAGDSVQIGFGVGKNTDSSPRQVTDKATAGGTKPNAASSSAARSYKKFNFSDETVDSKAGMLLAKPETSAFEKNETTKKGAELTFDDDGDDLLDALGFDDDTNSPRKKILLFSNRERNEQPQRPRTWLDDNMDSLMSPRHQERLPRATRKEQTHPQDKDQQERTSTGKETQGDEDLTFGSYQPTLGSTAEGRQSRRQSVRFSTEDVRASSPEDKPKTTALASTRPRGSADWLGLKTTDQLSSPEDDAKEKTSADSTLLERKPPLTVGHVTPAEPSSPTDRLITPPVAKSLKEETEDGWLAGSLNRKKTVSRSEAKQERREDLQLFASNRDALPTSKSRDHVNLSSTNETGSLLTQPVPAAHSTPVREERTPQVPPPPAPTAVQPQEKGAFSADGLQQLLLQQKMVQSQLLGLSGVVDVGTIQRHTEKEQHQALQARMVQLEGQVKSLQLERDQSRSMLESVQQRHIQDMELMENAHKTCVRLLEESAAQRETRLRQECDDLRDRLATATQAAEQERSELQAQYQRKLTQVQRDRDHEVERLRELQRKSILEMKKDHEDQVQRLKKLKEEEIDAVTSATSQTRSLTLVIEQMEQFSSRLGTLSSRVESTHEHTAHGLEQGARHRDEQLHVVQVRLAQQQKEMAEERTYLKEIISRMDTQLHEQQRQLEKERWKITAEQAKAECSQRNLEEERRSFSMQMNMEREELERAKSSLLEEQKSVMQNCAEERKKLAAEWAHLHAQERQWHERAEHEVSSLLERREGSIVSLAKEQADLKLRTAELKQKEAALAQERETLERQREEQDRDKETISRNALKLRTRAEEVEAFSRLAEEKYKKGEEALQEAKCVQAELEARLRNIHAQTERLRQQEQRVLQDRMELNRLQKGTGSLRPLQILPESVMPKPVPTSAPLPLLTTNPQSMMLQANLALWKYTAEKDSEYLQEQQIFLETLKKKPHRLFTE